MRIRSLTLRSVVPAAFAAALSETLDARAPSICSRFGRVIGGDPLPGGQWHCGHVARREKGGPRPRQVVHQPAAPAWPARGNRVVGTPDLHLVVVPFDGRRDAPVDEGIRALAHRVARRARVGAAAGVDQQCLLDVALCEGPLPSRDLDHRGPVLRARGSASWKARRSTPKPAAKVIRIATTARRPRVANGSKLRPTT